MSYTIQKSPTQILVNVQEELTIAQARRFRDDLLAAAIDPLPIVVDAKEAKRIDMSMAQILDSAQKTLDKVSIVNCSAEVKDYLSRAGVSIDRWVEQSPSNTTSVEGVVNG